MQPSNRPVHRLLCSRLLLSISRNANRDRNVMYSISIHPPTSPPTMITIHFPTEIHRDTVVMKIALPSTPTMHFDTIHSNLSVSSPSNLPLCSSESCLAFPAGRTASQAPTPGADQLGYGRWISYYYSAILFIFSLIYWMQRIRNRARQCSTQKTTPAQNLLALWRCWSYRRPAGRVGATFRMSYSMLSLLLLSLLITILLAFVQRPYYRPPVGEGPPPIGVRAGLMAVALMPPIVALSGKFNIVTLLTGISHERLNVLHRWVAYICMGLALVHALPFILVPLWDGGRAGLKEEYYQHGSSGVSELGSFVLSGCGHLRPTPGVLRGFDLGREEVARMLYSFFLSFVRSCIAVIDSTSSSLHGSCISFTTIPASTLFNDFCSTLQLSLLLCSHLLIPTLPKN